MKRAAHCSHLRFLLHAGDDALDGLLEVFEHDAVVEVAGGDEGRLVTHVRDVGACGGRNAVSRERTLGTRQQPYGIIMMIRRPWLGKR